MDIFTIYSNDQDVWEKLDFVAIKEGFSWGAFFFAPFWALWHGIWWVFIGVLVVYWFIYQVELSLLTFNYSEELILIILGFIFGLFGNDIRRIYLERRGYIFLDIVYDVNTDSAIEKFSQSGYMIFEKKDLIKELE